MDHEGDFIGSLVLIVIDTGHGKLSTWLDLRDAPARQQLLTLTSGADVFVQGFRPDALAKFGLTPEELIAERPGLVYDERNCPRRR